MMERRPATDEEVKRGIRNSENFLRLEHSNLDGKGHAELITRYRELSAMFKNPKILTAAIKGC